MKVFSATILFVLVTVFVFENSFAQPNWNKVPIPNLYKQATPYFLNAEVGFVFDAIGTPQSNLRKTTDGGNTWQAVLYFDQNNIFIRQIYFTGLNRGFAATSKGVYETKDGGITWQAIYNTNLPFNSVYAFGNMIFAFANDTSALAPWGPLIQSGDDGVTWDTIIAPTSYGVTVDNPMQPYVFGNKDSVVYAENITTINTTDNMTLMYSTNNGKNWNSNTLDKVNKTYTMGMIAQAHCNDLERTFIAPLDINGDDVYILVHSTDFGKTWDTLHAAFEVGAWVAISSCDQYICDALGTQSFQPKKGMWGSHDRGKNWSYIPAQDYTEIDDEDFHNLSVVGNGAVIYAGSLPINNRNDVWKTTNGGNGTLSFTAPGSELTTAYDLSSGGVDTLNILVCDTGFVRMFFQNMPCSIYANFQGITIDGLDPSEYTTQLHHHHLCDGLFDTLWVAIVPASANTRDLIVHAHFINDEYYPFDTSFKFTLKIIPGPNTIIYLKSSNIFGAVADTIDIPLYINSSTPLPQMASIDSTEHTYILHTDLITPISFVPKINGLTVDHFKTSTNTASLMIHFPKNYTFTGETEIGILRALVYLTDTMESDITMSGIVHGTGCQSILSNGVVHFSLAQKCGDSSLSKFIQYGSIDLIRNIIPNPARNSVLIELKNSSSQLHYDLFDELGVSRKSGIVMSNTFHLNTSDLSNGSYYLRVSGEKGMPSTKRLMISR